MGANEERAMTKGELVESIYLRINGGKATSQNTVKRIDIEFYAMAAIQSAWGVELKERQDLAIRAKRAGLPYDATVFNEFHVSETVTPQFDNQSNQYFIETPMVKSLGGSLSWEVAPVEGYEEIYKVDRRSDLNGIDTHGMMYAYYQRSNAGQRIYFINLPDSCGVLLSISQNISDLKDSDTLPIPSDKEESVIRMSVEYFTGQKMTPADLVIDQADIKNKVNAAN